MIKCLENMHNITFKGWLIHQIADVRGEGASSACWLALLYAPDAGVTDDELCELDSTPLPSLLWWADAGLGENMPVPGLAMQWH